MAQNRPVLSACNRSFTGTIEQWQAPDGIDEIGDTPRPRMVRVKLTSVQDVQKNLSKLYRFGWAKTLETPEAFKLANILRLIAWIMVTSDLDERIARLEGPC